MNTPTIEELAKANWLYIGGKYEEFRQYLASLNTLAIALESFRSEAPRSHAVGSLLSLMEIKSHLQMDDFDGALSFAASLVSGSEHAVVPLKREASIEIINIYASLKTYLNAKNRSNEFSRCQFLVEFAKSLDPETPEYLKRILPSYGLTE